MALGRGCFLERGFLYKLRKEVDKRCLFERGRLYDQFWRNCAPQIIEWVACSRLSDSGEDAKVKGTRKGEPVFLYVRNFWIQQTRLSRHLEQAMEWMEMFINEYFDKLCNEVGQYTIIYGIFQITDNNQDKSLISKYCVKREWVFADVE